MDQLPLIWGYPLSAPRVVPWTARPLGASRGAAGDAFDDEGPWHGNERGINAGFQEFPSDFNIPSGYLT